MGWSLPFVFNVAPQQRIDTWRKGPRLDENKQARELTTSREMAK